MPLNVDHLTVSVIQMCTGIDYRVNLQTASKLIESSVSAGAKLVVLPEYFLLMAQDEQSKFQVVESMGRGPTQSALKEWAIQFKVWIVAGSMPIESEDRKRPFSRCLVINPQGECAGFYDKVHLFDVLVDDNQGTYCESKYCTPGKRGTSIETPWGALGLSICYDIRFPELFRQYADQGCTMIALPAAFTVTTGKSHWKILIRARAIENQCYILASAQSGKHQNGRETWGHSMIVDPWGDIVAELTDQKEGILLAKLNFQRLSEIRRKMPVLDHRVLKP